MSSVSRFLGRFFSSTASTTTTSSTTSSKRTRLVKFFCRSIYRENNLKRAVEKFKKASDIDKFRTKQGIYVVMVRRLANAKCYGWIEEILEHQKQYKSMSKEGFSALLISMYGEAGMFEHAQKMFDEIPEHGCNQTALSFNALLGACVNSKKFDEFEGLFRNLPDKLGIEPNVISYTTKIKAFVEMGSLDSASMLLDEIEKKGLEPDLITFNTLFNGFYLNGRFADAEKIWDRMVSKNVTPDIRSYNARLYGMATEKKTKEAVELVEEMRSKEIEPDMYSFNALIRGFVNEGNLEEAKQWYRNMEESGASINKATFGLIVPFVCEKGDLEFAFDLCKKTFNKQCLVDQELLQLVVDSLVKESKIEEAKELVELGKTNKCCRYKLNLPSEE
ncbi:Pentatricopeptide repeat-containing protein [Melia azedarach]|uniref:Pentatricopeptide repeat-containing protein n=1 Tax=Melia azedarach TaxID=155640 RepID=A0ACC1WWK9_MELAZ|nr:Pentatricopeptide repeat-containing protein [Melia azedarach]